MTRTTLGQLHPLNSCTDDFSDCLPDLVMSPSISLLSKYLLCSSWGWFQGFQAWWTVAMLVTALLRMCRFDILGATLFTARIRNWMQYDSAFQSLAQVTSLSMSFSCPSSHLLLSHHLAGSRLLHRCSHLHFNLVTCIHSSGGVLF